MVCDKCKEPIAKDDDVYEQAGKKYCEDCYIEAVKSPKACDHSVVESIVSKRLDNK